MLTTDTIPRTQTLTVPTYTLPLPRCNDCHALLTLHGACPCQVVERRVMWHGVRYRLAWRERLGRVLVSWRGRAR
jgi:hypothetical protein